MSGPVPLVLLFPKARLISVPLSHTWLSCSPWSGIPCHCSSPPGSSTAGSPMVSTIGKGSSSSRTGDGPCGLSLGRPRPLRAPGIISISVELFRAGSHEMSSQAAPEAFHVGVR
ncbi:hypothetical protein MHYP_G00045370 [Metynnis hypsauchen]